MSNIQPQATLAGQIPSQQQTRQLLTQVQFATQSQLPATNDFDSQSSDDNEHNKNRKRKSGPTWIQFNDIVL